MGTMAKEKGKGKGKGRDRRRSGCRRSGRVLRGAHGSRSNSAYRQPERGTTMTPEEISNFKAPQARVDRAVQVRMLTEHDADGNPICRHCGGALTVIKPDEALMCSVCRVAFVVAKMETGPVYDADGNRICPRCGTVLLTRDEALVCPVCRTATVVVGNIVPIDPRAEGIPNLNLLNLLDHYADGTCPECGVAPDIFENGWALCCTCSVGWLRHPVASCEQLAPKFGSDFAAGERETRQRILTAMHAGYRYADVSGPRPPWVTDLVELRRSEWEPLHAARLRRMTSEQITAIVSDLNMPRAEKRRLKRDAISGDYEARYRVFMYSGTKEFVDWRPRTTEAGDGDHCPR